MPGEIKTPFLARSGNRCLLTFTFPAPGRVLVDADWWDEPNESDQVECSAFVRDIAERGSGRRVDLQEGLVNDEQRREEIAAEFQKAEGPMPLFDGFKRL